VDQFKAKYGGRFMVTRQMVFGPELMGYVKEIFPVDFDLPLIYSGSIGNVWMIANGYRQVVNKASDSSREWDTLSFLLFDSYACGSLRC
ncbi:hypothetical protein AVEN_90219-1, partial [Araneus ventricosus]